MSVLACVDIYESYVSRGAGVGKRERVFSEILDIDSSVTNSTSY